MKNISELVNEKYKDIDLKDLSVSFTVNGDKYVMNDLGQVTAAEALNILIMNFETFKRVEPKPKLNLIQGGKQ